MGEREAEALIRASLLCPLHGMRDCSPLLNGCSRVNNANAAFDALLARVATLTEALLETADELEAAYDAVNDIGSHLGARPVGRAKLWKARAALSSLPEGKEAE